MNQWMCELCFPEAKEIGIIAPGGYSLIYNQGKYHILGGQGHRDDEIITFEEMPWPDPDPDCADLPPEQEELADRWLDETDRLSESFKMHPETAFAFLSSCEEAGWKRGGFAHWLFNRAGRMIQGLSVDEEKKEEKAEPHWNYRVMIHSHRRRNEIEGVCPASKEVAVHEVHYKGDKPYGWTAKPVSLVADTTAELADMLEKIKLSLDKPAIPYETTRFEKGLYAYETSDSDEARPQDEEGQGDCPGQPRRNVVPDPPYSIWGQNGPDYIV